MAEDSLQTTQLQGWLQRIRAGDLSARDDLLRHVSEQLERLTRKMLQGYPGVKRWAQTDDVLQNALLRLVRSLPEVNPDSTRSFFGLAAQQIRRELIDLARHFGGPQGLGPKHASNAAVEEGPPLYDRADDSHEPGRLAQWCEFHQHVDDLPEEEREVVGLLFYQGMSQAEAAELLGVTVRTVQRRWQAALLRLHDLLEGELPGE
jgi:RNA polymerase sigma-70 factor (ECF subfamily)